MGVFVGFELLCWLLSNGSRVEAPIGDDNKQVKLRVTETLDLYVLSITKKARSFDYVFVCRQ